MELFSKFQRSWILFKTSVLIVLKHKKLLVFPVLTLFLTAIILLFFVTLIALQKTGYSYSQFAHWKAVGQTMFVETASDRTGGRPPVLIHFKHTSLGYSHARSLFFFL